MINCKVLTELKARKAKYGFAGYTHLGYIIPLGKLLESLHNNYTDADYSADLVGMHQTDFRVYTNNEDIANFIRDNFCIKS